LARAERPPGDQVAVTVTVGVSVTDAFDVFTREIDLWWRRGLKFRPSGKHVGVLHFEAGVGGRLFESYEVGKETRLVEVGRVRVWAPPSRLVFEWRNQNFAPDESTEVEVLFEPAGEASTQVTLYHRGWSSLRPDHPARHGNTGAAMSRMIGMWWGELMRGLREYVSERR
jgi:uncharacterized protein YndB with AHSA1/START domain